MELENFKKNTKRIKIIISSIIGITLIVGTIALFKTFAFYEEKKEFNIIKGRVPEFSREDIQLSYSINGEEGTNVFPNINDGLIANSVSCEKGASAKWSNSLWTLININPNGNKKVNCSVNFENGNPINLYENVSIGDYVSYIPILKNYAITRTQTGYDQNQIINPSELNLWRVIRKNEDGSIDLVSEYTSSSAIRIKGKVGYKNYIGTLNRIANSYETPGITDSSRYMGYDGQTEFITDETALNSTTVPWPNSSNINNSVKGSERERLGGGEELSVTDVEMVKAACGNTLKTYRVDATSTETKYWIANRKFHYTNDSKWEFNVRYADPKDDTVYGVGLYVYNEGLNDVIYTSFLRPIVTLKSGIQANNGNGSNENPWKVN